MPKLKVTKDGITKESKKPLHLRVSTEIAYALLTGIIVYHGVDSYCKIYRAGSNLGEKIGKYFEKRKKDQEAKKASEIS